MRAITYSPSPERAVFIRRYKRFFCDVAPERDPTNALTVHCPNSGSMRSCLVEGCPALILDSQNPERKLRYSLEALRLPDGWACLNTQRANQIVAWLMVRRTTWRQPGPFPGSRRFLEDFGYGRYTSEARYDAGTRFDGLIDPEHEQGPRHWIEIKSVSLRLSDTTLAFPDAVTERGQKHIRLLADIASSRAPKGQHPDRATLIYAIMRGSDENPAELARSFRVAHEIDPAYAAASTDASARGVQKRLLVIGVGLEGLDVRGYYEHP